MKGEKLVLVLVIIAFVLIGVVYLQLSQQGQNAEKKVEGFGQKLSSFTGTFNKMDSQFKDVLAKVKSLEDSVNSSGSQRDSDKKDMISKIESLSSQIQEMKSGLGASAAIKVEKPATITENPPVTTPQNALVAGNTTVELGEIPVQK